jgi:hypothetical protein
VDPIEPHPYPERSSPTRLSMSGHASYKGWSCIPLIFTGYPKQFLPIRNSNKEKLYISVLTFSLKVPLQYFTSIYLIRHTHQKIWTSSNSALHINKVNPLYIAVWKIATWHYGQKTTSPTATFPCFMHYTDYAAFNPVIAQLTTNTHLSLYHVPSKCFGISTAIIREVVNKGI